MIGDYHIHTHYSTDSEADPEDQIQKAMFLGMKEICFTDHLDLDYAPDENGNPQFKLDAEAYYNSLSELREKYRGHIKIKIGFEMGLSPEFITQNRDFAKSKPWDFIIGSTHQINGVDPYYTSAWEGKAAKDVIFDYYEMCLRNLTGNNDYDVFGHMDYIRRYVPDRSFVYDEKDYYDITEMMLKHLIATGKGMELNTKGLHNGVTQFIPTISLLHRYKNLGGEIITIGSDAHTVDSVGYSFKIAQEILQNIGFKYVTTFEDRMPSFVAI